MVQTSVPVEEMLKRLNKMYDKEEELARQLRQVQEDKELMQIIIMHQLNKKGREKNG
jgi:hypothetical protein